MCCVITVLAGSFGLACGDDGDDDGGTDVAGSGGSAGASAGTTGASGRGATAGRGSAGRMGGGNAMQSCPAGKPAATAMCTPAMGTCRYDGLVCDCITGMNSWACWDPATCPTTTLPDERSACPTVGQACTVGRTNCSCTDEGWNCGRQYCPPVEPAAGGECEGGTGLCTYGDRRCDCDQSKWVCWSNSDCPATPPARRAQCTTRGVICDFTGGTCECNGNAWTCDRGVTRPEPEQDGGSEDAGL